MINSQNTINDGLDLTTCNKNDGIVWSYNQGVILCRLVELNLATPDPTFLVPSPRNCHSCDRQSRRYRWHPPRAKRTQLWGRCKSIQGRFGAKPANPAWCLPQSFIRLGFATKCRQHPATQPKQRKRAVGGLVRTVRVTRKYKHTKQCTGRSLGSGNNLVAPKRWTASCTPSCHPPEGFLFDSTTCTPYSLSRSESASSTRPRRLHRGGRHRHVRLLQ